MNPLIGGKADNVQYEVIVYIIVEIVRYAYVLFETL